MAQPNDPDNPIEVNQRLVFKVPAGLIADVHFSVPAWSKINGALGYVRDEVRCPKGTDPADLPVVVLPDGCKLPYEKHLQALGIRPAQPSLLISARNLGNNLRIIAYRAGDGLLQLRGEDADTSGRPYACLCRDRHGSLLMDRVSFRDGRPSRDDLQWALSGQPLVWNGALGHRDEILAYTYDLRHFYAMPAAYSGKERREERGGPARELITFWTQNSHLPPKQLARKVAEEARRKRYPRERHYLHSAIGLTESSDPIVAQMHGSFEDVGKVLLAAGAQWAIELDEGGSVSTNLGGHESIAAGRVFASHYFRPRGTALLVFTLRVDPQERLPIRENSRLGAR